MFKVEIRSDCKECHGPLPNARFRTFCGKICRTKANNRKASAYQGNYQREQRDKKAEAPSDKKVQCLICGKWYVQVGSHVVAIHHITAREYREQFELEVKRGTVPQWYREVKGEQAIENGTYKNLEAGEKYRFKKGDKVGSYKRSLVTLERLKNKHKVNNSLSTNTPIVATVD